MRFNSSLEIIILDEVELPEDIICLLESKSAGVNKTPCFWQQLNSIYKIKGFSAGVFLSLDQNLSDKLVIAAAPVFIQAGLNGAIVADNRPVGLDMADANNIKTALVPTLKEFGFELKIINPYEWFLLADELPILDNPPTECSFEKMLKLHSDPRLNRFHNEVQISLHNLELNDKRLSLGLNPINSLWLWTGTKAKAQAKSNRPVFSNNERIITWANYFNLPHRPLIEFRPEKPIAVMVIDTAVTTETWDKLLNPKIRASFSYRGAYYQ